MKTEVAEMFLRKTKSSNKTCVQCQKKLFENRLESSLHHFAQRFCDNPACPNYALFCVPLEEMPKETTELSVKVNKK